MKLRSELDLTNGRFFEKIFKFVIPLMMTTIFQLLYTSVDLWTVSKYGGGTLSMTSIGSNSALIHLIVTFLTSTATGANVAISTAKGAGNKEKANRILHTSLLIGFVGGIIFGILGFIFSPYLLTLMKTPDTMIENATLYLKVYFLGVPLYATYNFGSQMLRALGDSKRPLYFLMISGCVNILFDLLFVIVFGLDVLGVALATVISGGVSAFLVIWWFKENPKNGYVQLNFKDLKFSKDELIEVLKIGIPGGIQGLAFCIPNVLIQSSLYTITNHTINGIAISVEEVASGSAASQQIEGYIFAMLDAFCIGLISFVGQNNGARKKKNIKKCYWYSLLWILIFAVISSLAVLFFNKELLSIFITSSEDINIEKALLAGKERLFIMAFTYFLDGWMDLNGSYLRGLKYSTPPAIITILGCSVSRIVFLFTLFKLPYFHTIFWLYFAFPLSWTLVNIVYLPVCLYYRKKAYLKIDMGQV